MKTTQAQRRATDTYRKKNPEKIRYQNTLGSARSFINPKTEKMKNNIKVAGTMPCQGNTRKNKNLV